METLSHCRADLLGRGWGEWRLGWRSDRRLVAHAGDWVLEERGRERQRWPSFASAMGDLWPRRRWRDRRPWLIGWMDYEEAARVAGGLPTHTSDPGQPTGCWLFEPEAAGAAEAGRSRAPWSPASGRWSLDAAAFRRGVEEVRRRIAAGQVYQVNLCRQFAVGNARGGAGPLAASAAKGGSPDYLAVITAAETEIVCASMELLLSASGDRLETRPIKGTRPRGADEVDDRRLRRELETDAKERSELAMVVDLERNDLGRVCEVGSVEVVDPASVHTYASVHHLVARIVGRRRGGLPWWELLAAMAPGGSVTGCPKQAAMGVVRDLETVPRGPYTGVLGLVACDGDLEMALPIRTAWRRDGELRFGAGCGIVWDSDPEAEEAESRLKVARWLELVEGTR